MNRCHNTFIIPHFIILYFSLSENATGKRKSTKMQMCKIRNSVNELETQ